MSMDTDHSHADPVPGSVTTHANRFLVGLLAFLLLIQLKSSAPEEGYSGAWSGPRGLQVVAKVHRAIRNDFCEPPTDQQLFEAAIRGMMAELEDPYSRYLPPVSVMEVSDLLNRRAQGGIGIYAEWEKGQGVRVREVVPTGPAESAGIKGGDLIVQIDRAWLSVLRWDQARALLRGRIGSRVTLVIERDGVAPFRVQVTRGPIPEKKRVDGFMLAPKHGIGLLRVFTFGTGTAESARKVLQTLKASGMRALIIDLRWNAGGDLDEGLATADLFLRDRIIAVVEYRNPSQYQREPLRLPHRAGVDAAWEGPTAVLINGVTASAAELLCAALRESGDASVFGETSFGKSAIQEIKPLGATGGALQLTIGRYLTPNRNDIQGAGLDPDEAIAVEEGVTAKLVEVWMRAIHGVAEPEDTQIFDPVRQRALEVLLQTVSNETGETDGAK